MSRRYEQAWFGGGDPDRTGDPRLMSPLLCQLSYTATPKKLTSYSAGVKEDSPTVPVFVPVSVRAAFWRSAGLTIW